MWHKSSYSNGNGGGNCVEVDVRPGEVAVRDSKDPAGPVLSFDRRVWAEFLEFVGETDDSRLHLL